MTDAQIHLRAALPSDAPLIFALIGELAAYEKMAQEVVADEGMIAAALFGDAPRAFCTIAEHDGIAAGFLLWFYTFSTFRGRHGIWIEDLYVREPLRGHGIGRALLMSAAHRCRDEKLGRLEWSVLNWNAPAIGFYEKVGAKLLRDWTICRLDGAALVDFDGKAGMP